MRNSTSRVHCLGSQGLPLYRSFITSISVRNHHLCSGRSFRRLIYGFVIMRVLAMLAATVMLTTTDDDGCSDKEAIFLFDNILYAICLFANACVAVYAAKRLLAFGNDGLFIKT